jgi:hypothetical protein
MLKNATVSFWKPWRTMPFRTELLRGGSPHLKEDVQYLAPQCNFMQFQLPACTSSLKCGSSSCDSSVWKGIVPHGFHKLIVTFSSISPSQYGYFDVGILF